MSDTEWFTEVWRGTLTGQEVGTDAWFADALYPRLCAQLRYIEADRAWAVRRNGEWSRRQNLLACKLIRELATELARQAAASGRYTWRNPVLVRTVRRAGSARHPEDVAKVLRERLAVPNLEALVPAGRPSARQGA